MGEQISLQDILSQQELEKTRQEEIPEFFEPMLATLTKDYFNHKSWIYERKLDGERALAFCREGKVNLASRNNKDLNPRYPEIVRALENYSKDFVIDGEIVAFRGNKTSFGKLQKRMHSYPEAKDFKIKVYYYVFDIIFFQNFNLSKLELTQRKRILKRIFVFKQPVRFLVHRRENGIAYFRQACRKSWEGIIAKDGCSTYAGGRSKKWLKFKCINRQEFVIGGYTRPQSSRIGFGALLIGYYSNGNLIYAGKTGTGFDDETLGFLKEKFKKLKVSQSPFFQPAKIRDKDVRWLKPVLVCEVGFTEWTSDGKLRHPRYLGLREDKDPREVTKER
ncbi:MAG: non-homologous end-joining DNA ligase [Actinomycetota bacterium]